MFGKTQDMTLNFNYAPFRLDITLGMLRFYQPVGDLLLPPVHFVQRKIQFGGGSLPEPSQYLIFVHELSPKSNNITL
jgi:hypothetical protein